MGRLSIPTYNSLSALLQSFPISSRVEDNSGGRPELSEFSLKRWLLKPFPPSLVQTTGMHCQQAPLLSNWQRSQWSKTLNPKPCLFKKGFHGFLGTNFTVLG
ncbi:hypothetical protein TWF569_008582 [Orbilia oligospora]|uniref:Uncharacterized protein n=1 Tax=Orbilia oligospora TaxID=2813651 RepID=A0A7C8N3T0_ORBOL|nr:hypothetical protein TWF706_011888 [Orbilia oligospora]KAF3086459.1 hypothetical protein TWF102_011057 [Orbilia oligospora]KAF3092510.1 hypothetical protein TWF103_011230 [Orbilia oligospora]KAF3139334.1 hypothetical protein TWF569_008582 [Orbilia oligospora]KAF3144895.1 hypothetical protein TWF594_004485 [Orbilia oligospora]